MNELARIGICCPAELAVRLEDCNHIPLNKIKQDRIYK